MCLKKEGRRWHQWSFQHSHQAGTQSFPQGLLGKEIKVNPLGLLWLHLSYYCQRGISARLEEEQSFWEVRLRAPSTSKQQTLLPGWEVFTTVLGPTRVVPNTDGGPFLTKLINIRAVQKFPII